MAPHRTKSYIAALVAAALAPAFVVAQGYVGGPVVRSPGFGGVPYNSGMPGYTPGYSPFSYSPFATAGGSFFYYFPSYNAGAPFSGTIGTFNPFPTTAPIAGPTIQYLAPIESAPNTSIRGLGTPLGGADLLPGFDPRIGELLKDRPEMANPPAPAAQAQPANAAKTSAQFTVRLPADAQLWVEEQLTRPTGTVRQFHTPANLTPVQKYAYSFRALWRENDRQVTQERTVTFRAGDAVTVDFTRPQ